jgi:hypothetical protein
MTVSMDNVKYSIIYRKNLHFQSPSSPEAAKHWLICCRNNYDR